MGKGIKFSEKHGVNPTITLCPVCGKETGIAMLGKLKNDAEAPKYIIGDICNECITKAGKDKIYVLATNGDSIKGCAMISRSSLNIQVKGVVVMMKEDKFNQVFQK